MRSLSKISSLILSSFLPDYTEIFVLFMRPFIGNIDYIYRYIYQFSKF